MCRVMGHTPLTRLLQSGSTVMSRDFRWVWVGNDPSIRERPKFGPNFLSFTTPVVMCRYDERLKTQVEGSTRHGYTGSIGELEHLKIETRLIDEMFPSVMCEYVFLK